MGYWKREYTERRNGKPLFRPESKTEANPPPAEKEQDESPESDPVPTKSP